MRLRAYRNLTGSYSALRAVISCNGDSVSRAMHESDVGGDKPDIAVSFTIKVYTSIAPRGICEAVEEIQQVENVISTVSKLCRQTTGNSNAG